MILKFGFKYISTSLVYEKILLRALDESELQGKLEKDGLHIFLYVKGSEEELENFAKYLSKELPHSLFLKDSSVEVVSNMPSDNYILPDYPRRELPFCPKCHKEALKNSDPFVKCEVCGYNVQKSKIVYKNFAKEIKENNSTIFENLANAVKNGAIVKVKTFNGYKKISLPNEKNFKKFADNFKLLFYDLQSINEIFPLRKSEILAIGSFEKPFVNFWVSKELLKMYPFFDKTNHVDIKLSDDLMLELIMYNLKKIGVSFVLLGDVNDRDKFNISLNFEGEINPRDDLKVIVLDDGRILLGEGDRTLLPKINQNFSPLPVKAFSKNYVSINTDKYIITYDKFKKLPEVLNTFYLKDKKTSDNTYEASHGAFYSGIAENDLFDKVVSGIYLSKENSDKIMIYSKKFGLVDYLGFDYKYPENVKKLLDLISSENETSKKLVANYRAKFSDIDEKKFEFDNMGDIYKLWGVIGIVLGFYEGEDIKSSAKILCDNAYSFKGKKGPRIDYKLIREGSKVKLDMLTALKTSMSFKLAGIDAPTLCFGVMESFAEFVSNLVDEISGDYEIEGVCMGGSLFSMENFTNKFYTITNKNYTVFTNLEFTLDDINLGYGIISGLTKEV